MHRDDDDGIENGAPQDAEKEEVALNSKKEDIGVGDTSSMKNQPETLVDWGQVEAEKTASEKDRSMPGKERSSAAQELLSN